MKKILLTLRNILIGIFLIVYFSFIILISTLLLNRNEYGVTQFNDKALILIDEEVSNFNYSSGSLVIVEKKDITELQVGEEIFVYHTNKREKTVKIVISPIEKINLDVSSPYIVLANDGTAWGEEFIAGTALSVYDDIGGILSFVESKWVFFSLLIVPCFFILLYEIYLVIVTIKFGDIEETDDREAEKEIKKKEQKYQEAIDSKDEQIEELMKQINELKKENKNSKKNK